MGFVWKIVWNMDGEKNLRYLEKALSGIPEDFSGKLLEVPVGTGVLAMQAIHAALIREGTCVTSDCCDYCIVGDKSPMAAEYELKRADNGLLLSVRKESR